MQQLRDQEAAQGVGAGTACRAQERVADRGPDGGEPGRYGAPAGVDADGPQEVAGDLAQRTRVSLTDEVGAAARRLRRSPQAVQGEQMGVGGGTDMGGVDEVGAVTGHQQAAGPHGARENGGEMGVAGAPDDVRAQ